MTKGKLLKITESKLNSVDTVGFFEIDNNKTYIKKNKIINKNIYSEKQILSKLKGVVSQRNKDTLFIKFWNIEIESDPVKGLRRDTIVNSADNSSDFIYVIDSLNGWKKSNAIRVKKTLPFIGIKKYGGYFDVPFRFKELMATNLPFRILTRTGKLESNFLNANIAYLFVYGHTRIFKSEFIKNKNRFKALGPYLGLSSIDNPVNDKNEFGLNYGINAIWGFQSFNITLAYGWQNGFKKETKEIQPYFAIGIGFKLLENFTPEIKNKGE